MSEKNKIKKSLTEEILEEMFKKIEIIDTVTSNHVVDQNFVQQFLQITPSPFHCSSPTRS